MPGVTSVPNAPAEIRGVINLRGNIIPLIDLRVRLGLPSIKTETDALVQLLHERERDHLNWLKELEASVRERRPFGLAKDPHKCKFGIWYDQFKTESSMVRATLQLSTTIQRMDEPHRIIHATANEVLRLAEKGNSDGALALISARRNGELAALVKLFADLRQTLMDDRREVAVVLCFGARRLAVSVDMVEAVERIPEENIEPPSAVIDGLHTGFQFRIAKRVRTDQTILLPDSGFFHSSAGAN